MPVLLAITHTPGFTEPGLEWPCCRIQTFEFGYREAPYG